MTEDRGGGLSAEDREALFAHVSRRRASAPAPRVGPASIAAPEGATDFTTLPGFKELQTQSTFAAMIGLENPFFRTHERRAGAETLIGNRTLSNFSSYDYLGLNGHPEVQDAAKEAIERYGTSASASRLVAGERPVHRELERALAEVYQAEDCVVLVSGHATNVGVIGQLVGPKDLIVHDELIHNSIVVGAQLSGAQRRSFAHNDLDALEKLLVASRRQYHRVLIVAEGLYSMDGDWPDLARLVDLKKRFGAWLMMDEAHSLGVLGKSGLGIWEETGIDPREVDIWMGTLSKTLSGAGGYIAGSAALVEYIKTSVGAFVFSVGLSPPVAAASRKALEIMLREPERVERLHRNGKLFVEVAREHGLDTGTAAGTAIAPVILGESLKAAMLSNKLSERGFNVMPILHPAVPERLARLRFFITSEHTPEQIKEAARVTAEEIAGLAGTTEVLQNLAKSFS
ncbi:aminotransferase class I/II-fold pyridoxal phosphate-dependent enzyme [Enterovirga sp. CN4-39]|uniref:aminotransferase class I/II-fold pyridoxal phosphate-dependent enzyme n=1 Tax=Enterovirga sp. CN4-39 TaxID=3400910 RepID=UPI003C0DC073